MRFIHIADMHLDSPFATLANKENLAIKRRLEQRKVMKEIVEYIKENDIPYFFIAGDFYEQEYIRKTTIDYINELFKEIPNTKIFITPGNHDPYIKNSFYNQYKWNENVHIFKDQIEKVNCGNVDIYGYGFNDFYINSKSNEIEIQDKDKINILITHGSLDSGVEENRKYNPLTTNELKNKGFDYIALGHIHKTSYNDYENQRIVYPGSTVSLGFDELGKRGFIDGNIDENIRKIELKFIETSAKTFEEKEINVDSINSEEELIETINLEKLDNNKYYKLVLVGKRNFEINENKIIGIVNKINIIKIKDNTDINYDIEEISNQISLKGLFAKKILERIEKTEDEEERKQLLNAFEIGMEAFNK